MPTELIALALAILPPLLLVWHYWRQDVRSPEPKGLILKVFAVGVATTIPLGLAELAFEGVVKAVFPPLPFLLAIFVQAFLMAALMEEWGKRWTVERFASGHQAYNEHHDGILYAIVASLGFALLENICYAAGNPAIGLVRAFTAVPMHAIAAGLMGYHLGLARFSADDAARRGHRARGLMVAVAFHGFYDYVLFSASLAAVLVFPLLLWGAYQLRRHIAHAHALDAEHHGAAVEAAA